MDRFNPFIIEVGVTSPQREVTTGNGNETLEDLSGFPVVTVTGTTQVQVIHKTTNFLYTHAVMYEMYTCTL